MGVEGIKAVRSPSCSRAVHGVRKAFVGPVPQLNFSLCPNSTSLFAQLFFLTLPSTL
jgi:hypothetical protein